MPITPSKISATTGKRIKGATSFDLQGGEMLERMLKDFPKKIQESILDASVRAGSTVLRKEARNNLKANGSVKTGRLLKSLKIKKVRGVHGFDKVFTDRTAPHAHLVEFGTAPRRLKTPHYVKMKGQWVWVEHTGQMPAKPFLRPAADENHKKILRAMMQRMAKRMAAEATKMAGRYGTLKKHYKRRLAG